MSPRETRPSEPTRQAERSEAGQPHRSDRDPTPEESEAADSQESTLSAEDRKSVADHEREMAERGAHQKGEGRPE